MNDGSYLPSSLYESARLVVVNAPKGLGLRYPTFRETLKWLAAAVRFEERARGLDQAVLSHYVDEDVDD